jgi:hypothetical protein
MKKILFLLLFIFSVLVVNGQTPISIYSPNFSNAGGWQINGNASIISSSYLRLTPNTGGQSGSKKFLYHLISHFQLILFLK